MYCCGMIFLCLSVIFGKWFHILTCLRELGKHEQSFSWIKRVIMVSEGGREIEKICNDVDNYTIFSDFDICSVTERLSDNCVVFKDSNSGSYSITM